VQGSGSKEAFQALKAELDKMKALHWMHCANCGWELQELIFKGLTIHRCFHCGGTFLTEEEFEKLCGKESTFLDTVIDMFKF
jgi:DNA-directed RNA polymerase subunit RPC12/RpoP